MVLAFELTVGGILVAESSQGIWATIGKIGVLIGLALGLQQVYINFIKTDDISIEATGTCRPIYLPGSITQNLKRTNVYPTSDEIEKVLPEKLANKRLIALNIADVNSKRKSDLDLAATALTNLRSYCSFDLVNDGKKEVQEVSLQLPRDGVYFIDKLGESAKELGFKKIISIGKLNPGGKVHIATWNTDFDADLDVWEMDDFRVTHTAGIRQVEFLSENTTAIGYLYERYPNSSFILFMALLVGVSWIGVALGKASEKERVEKEAKKKAEEEKKPEEPKPDELKTEATGELAQGEPYKEPNTAPRSPS